MKCVKKTLLITLGPLERHHLAGANSALPVECFPKEPFNSSSPQQTRPCHAPSCWFLWPGIHRQRRRPGVWSQRSESSPGSAGRVEALGKVPAAHGREVPRRPCSIPSHRGAELGNSTSNPVRGVPCSPPWLRRCSRAGSGSRSPWGTPPACGTTPSCGWCGRRGRR